MKINDYSVSSYFYVFVNNFFFDLQSSNFWYAAGNSHRPRELHSAKWVDGTDEVAAFFRLPAFRPSEAKRSAHLVAEIHALSEYLVPQGRLREQQRGNLNEAPLDDTTVFYWATLSLEYSIDAYFWLLYKYVSISWRVRGCVLWI